MTGQGDTIAPATIRARIQRHAVELIRLGWPVTLSRIGIIVMVNVNIWMVGRHSTEAVAYLGIGQSTLVGIMLVTCIGLLTGTTVYTARAFGEGNFEECGQVWRRSLPLALGFGILSALVCWPGEAFLLFRGQPDDVARQGGEVMRILALGLPPYFLYVASTFFLEGVSRPKAGTAMMVLANVLNFLLNWVLVLGHLGFPELAEEGSAWATTIVRWVLGLGLVAYIWFSPSLSEYGVRKRKHTPWKDWSGQRTMGYAGAISLGAEVVAFAEMNYVAGKIGTLSLAAYSLFMTINGLAFMIGAGLGTAVMVRVGIANARGQIWDAKIATWTGLALMTVPLGLYAFVVAGFPEQIFGFFRDDPELIAFCASAALFVAILPVTDAGQVLMNGALRGLGQAWVPTAIQTFCFFGILIPFGYYFAIELNRDVVGLVQAVIIGCSASMVAQGAWFYWLTHPRRHAG